MLAIDGMNLEGLLEEGLQAQTGHAQHARVELRAAREREPAVAAQPLADGNAEGSLRTQDQCFAPVQGGSEAQQVVCAGAPAVKRNDGREGAFTRGYVCGVEQLHRASLR